MSTLKNVALLGKGTLGSAILKELVDAGFNVTVFGRSESNRKGLSPGVKFALVDYSSTDNLVSALEGQDAVISTLSKGGIFHQKTIIDASIKASVKRFVPSDWGTFTTDPKAQQELAVVLGPMVDIQNYLADKARAGEIEYNIFSVGGFLDFLIQFPLAFDYANKTVELWDAGSYPISATSLSTIGKAVVGALKNPEATKNRNLKIHELVVTQAQLVALAKKYSPPATEWKEVKVDGEAAFAKAVEAVKADPSNEYAIVGAIKAGLLAGRFTSSYKKIDNDLVGIPLLSDADLEARFAAVYQS